MAFAVAMNEWLTVTTSSPLDTPHAASARCSAVVQLDTAQACGAPTAAANSRSNAATSGPCVTQPERIARRAASASRSSSSGRATGIVVAVVTLRTRSARHHFTSRDSPSSSVTDAEKPSMLFAFSVEASRLGTGFTLRSGPYSGATRTPITRPSAAARSLRLVSTPVATLNTSSDTSDANANTFARATSST